MSRDLVIRASRTPDQSLGWTLIEAGERLAEGKDIGELPDPGFDQVFLVLPAQEVFVSRIKLAARSQKEAQQAAPYVIEDDLAVPLENTEVLVSGKSGDLRYVYAVRKELAEAWRKAIHPLGVGKIWCVPDALAAARLDGPTIFDEGNDLLVCALDHNRPAQRVEGALAAEVFPALLAAYKFGQVNLTPRVRLPAMTRGEMPQMVAQQPIDIDVAITQLPLPVLESLPSLVSKTTGSGDVLSHARVFARAAIAAGMALILALALWIGEGFYFQTQRDNLDSAAMQIFADAFPDVTRIVNAEAQLRQRLNTLGGEAGGSDFLLLVSLLSEAIAETDQVEIDSIRFDANTTRLNVTAIYSDFADFDAIRQAGEARGLIIEDSGTQSGNVLIGDFSVRLS